MVESSKDFDGGDNGQLIEIAEVITKLSSKGQFCCSRFAVHTISQNISHISGGTVLAL